jgi:hypothetical protein
MTNIREIKKTSWLDAPAKLRELAAALESRGKPTTTVIVITADGTNMEVRGFGERTSGIEIAGYLSRALFIQNDLPNCALVDDGAPPAA